MARVLVVEDDSAIRRLVVEVLAADGYETDEAIDGLAAYDLIRGDRPVNLVVLDLFMPRMDGREFLNVSRMVPSYADVPVLVLSASDHLPADRRIRAFLKKPFDVGVLSEAVRSILERPAAVPSS